jgi:hypothetical protein
MSEKVRSDRAQWLTIKREVSLRIFGCLSLEQFIRPVPCRNRRSALTTAGTPVGVSARANMHSLRTICERWPIDEGGAAVSTAAAND